MIIVALLALIVGAIGILSVDKTHVFFTTEVVEKIAGSKPFSAPGEQVFLAFAILVGIVSGAVQAASRSLLARIAPAGQDYAVLRSLCILRQGHGVSGAVLRRLHHARDR